MTPYFTKVNSVDNTIEDPLRHHTVTYNATSSGTTTTTSNLKLAAPTIIDTTAETTQAQEGEVQGGEEDYKATS